jgi:3-phosphoshikimate 1-carboxyvinyltransferase
MSVTVYHPTGRLEGSVRLPSSKSESNRALIIQALSGASSELKNLSEANDTQLLLRLLQDEGAVINAEDAGTVMRFLTAYYVVTNQHKTLTGTPRMCKRPIGVLVEALRELGAHIHFTGEEGYPPLELKGMDAYQPFLTELCVRGDISSQYISALLMIAPSLPHGLTVRLTGKIYSRPYILMTLSLMEHFGVKGTFEGDLVQVKPQRYQPNAYTIESDWSAASYWYSMVALAQEAELELLGLKEKSFQGDRAIADIMDGIGVQTEYKEGGVRLTKKDKQIKVVYDFADCPDLAQTVAVACAALGIHLEMTGLESLRIKETDRIAALQQELRKIGAELEDKGEGLFVIGTHRSEPAEKLSFDTYEDHRMAMAFAPLGLLSPVEIHEPSVVRKSYPGFWKDLERMGFETMFPG